MPKTLMIRRIPDAIWHAFRAKAVARNESPRDRVVELMRQDAVAPEPDTLRPLHERWEDGTP